MASSEPAARQAPAASVTGSEKSASADGQETWDALYLGGTKIGYSSSRVIPVTIEGREMSRVYIHQQLAVKRGSEQTLVESHAQSLETPAGELVSFQLQTAMGDSPTVTKGAVRDGKLHLTTSTLGTTDTNVLDCPAGTAGLLAVEQTLASKPLQPGEQRTFTALCLNQVAQVKLTAGDFEPARLLDRTQELLRIDCTITLDAQNQLPSVLWANRQGELLKQLMSGMESYRTSRETAELQDSAGGFDLLVGTSVRLDRPLRSGHDSRRIRYRVKLKTENPATVFPAGLAQQLQSVDEHTAELTVEAIRPDSQNPRAAGGVSQPGSEYVEPNNLIQSDNPAIAHLAAEVAGKETDPWKVALALEQFVHAFITETSFSQALASASDLVQSRKGDCTEYAVLLAALARARGLPARVAVGLVYVPSTQTFGFHMWDEVWIEGRWIGLDATLAKGGIGAAHLKLSDSALQGATAYNSFLPVARLLGNLQIEVLEEQ